MQVYFHFLDTLFFGVEISFIQMLLCYGLKDSKSLFRVISIVATTVQKGSCRGLELSNFRVLYRLSEIGFFVFFILKHCYWLSLHLLSSFVVTCELKEHCKKFTTFTFLKDKLHRWCERYSGYLFTSLRKQLILFLERGSDFQEKNKFFVVLICQLADSSLPFFHDAPNLCFLF